MHGCEPFLFEVANCDLNKLSQIIHASVFLRLTAGS
jgi:hypothetical protein